MTKCDSLGPIVIFHTFAKCCVLRYYYYVGTGYVFFSSTASYDLRIFTIASIRSPDKETIEWLYLLRSAKLCALWTAQSFICANCLPPVLRRAQTRRKMGSTICPMSEIVCFPVLTFTYSHVENSLFFALDLAVSL